MSDEQQPSSETSEQLRGSAAAGQQPDARQWVPVPPPHPYTEAPKPPAGKGLAITAMSLGLVALLTSIVSALYFSVFVALAGFIGIVAVIMGIVALVKRSRPKGAAITGLVTGTVSVVVALLVGVLGLFALTANLIGQSSPSTGSGGGQVESESEEWSPDSATEVLIEWPANMASGGIVFMGPGDPRPLEANPLEPGTAPQPNPVDRASGANDLLIYVDYRCPHCSSFEQANSTLLESAIAAGDSVEIVPLSFLDRASEGAYYSSRAAAAMACLADSQPEAAWQAHLTLLSPAVQPGAGPGLSNDELISVIDRAAQGGLGAAAVDCIQTERFVPFAQALNAWVFATTVPNAVDENLRVEGTPLAVVNGMPYYGEPSDAAAFAAFYAEHTN